MVLVRRTITGIDRCAFGHEVPLTSVMTEKTFKCVYRRH